MNKKASIPITILVIGIFLICTLALISFILAKSSARDSFSGVALMEKMNSQIEDYSVNQDLGNIDTRVNDLGKRVFYQEKIDYSILPWKKDMVIFSLEYPIN
jgi:hypothetical protein